MSKIKIWDICLADIPFEESPLHFKKRPLIVLPNNHYIKLTTHAPRANYLGEYVLQEWKEAGLHCPTTARLSKIAALPLQTNLVKIGHLSNIDKENIRIILQHNK